MTGMELYEFVGREADVDDYIDYLIDEKEIKIGGEEMIDAYKEYLKQEGDPPIYEDLDELLDGYTPKEVIEIIDFSDFNIGNEYFRFNTWGYV